MNYLSTSIFSIFIATILVQPAFAILDADSDLMSDIWESRYGFSTTGSATPEQSAAADPDGDGSSNLQESIAGPIP
jgi:hypothetical protein